MKKIFYLLVLFGGIYSSRAQKFTAHKKLTAGYTYHQHHFLELGAKVLLLSNDDIMYRFGVSGLLGMQRNDVLVIPKLQTEILFNFQRNVDIYHAYYFSVGTDVTTEYIAPKVGATLLGVLDVHIGYGFPLGKGLLYTQRFEGTTVGLSLNIPWVMLKKK